eukprot:411909-Prorocentrum_minimum.AAC.6
MPLTYCTTHPEDAPGTLHSQSGSEAYGRAGGQLLPLPADVAAGGDHDAAAAADAQRRLQAPLHAVPAAALPTAHLPQGGRGRRRPAGERKYIASQIRSLDISYVK